MTEPKCIYGEDFLSKDERFRLARQWDNFENADFEIIQKSKSHFAKIGGTEEYYVNDEDRIVVDAYKRFGLRVEKCWVAVDNIPNCYYYIGALRGDDSILSSYYSPYHVPRRKFDWSEQCVDGLVSGEGTLTFNRWEFEGKFVQGKRNGKVFYDSVRERSSEGEYIMGLKEGKWTIHDRYGNILQKVNYSKGRFDGDCEYIYIQYYNTEIYSSDSVITTFKNGIRVDSTHRGPCL